MFYYLGVDIGGGENTWAVALVEEGSAGKIALYLEGLSFAGQRKVALSEIERFCLSERVLGIAIDAPLSFSLNLEKGFRASDRRLRELLPREYRSWVLSYHGLMGIPIRAYFFAKHLSPYCGTIIETHPRAGLYFILPEERKVLAWKYKRSGLSEEETRWLKEFLEEKFSLSISDAFESSVMRKEGILDALMCALTAFTYHRFPERLLFLPSEEGLEGFGPFVVLNF